MKEIKLVGDTIKKEDVKSLISWLDQDPTPKLTKGDLTIELEKKWAKKLGTKYSIFVNSGSSAILLTLAAINQIGLKNKKIVVPALSWATDVSSPMLLGYDVILCDCNLQDLSCDLDELEKLFKLHNPSTFILVSALGFVPDIDKILELCNKYDVILLEDNCESMGSKYNGKYLGTFGHASFFSMYFGHHLSTIEGGFINTDDDDLYHMLLMMRSHGWDRDLPIEIQKEIRNKYNKTDFDSLYNFYVPGFNLRSTDLQAFLGIRAIDRLDEYCDIRNENFNIYNNGIKSNKLNLLVREGDFISNFAYPVVSYNRDNIIRELKLNKIEARPLISGNIANKPFWFEKYGSKLNFKNADIIDSYGFYLPNHHELTKEDIDLIIKIIENNK